MPDQKPVMYGINNCDTIKKAKSWLNEHHIDFDFHDYKKLGIEHSQLTQWVQQLGWEQLINKRGTSWRKLDESSKQNMDDQLAVTVMMDNPSIIKRPLLVMGEQKILGFDQQQYQQLFSG